MPLTRRERRLAWVVAALFVPVALVAHHARTLRYTALPAHPTTYLDGHYAFERTQPSNPSLPVGFDSCLPVPVLIDFQDAPHGIAAMVKHTLHDLDQASGLHLRYDGAGHSADADYASGRRVVVVRFVHSASDPVLKENAGYTQNYTYPAANGLTYYSIGRITIAAEVIARYGENAMATVLLHEFGHVVGLGHTTGDEIMTPPNYHRITYAHGDLTGLAKLGQLTCA